MWKYNGVVRPSFAEATLAGQESVWDYPRPPELRADTRTVTVYSKEILIARTSTSIRVLETAGAPTFYIPPKDVRQQYLLNIDHRSYCEWKGVATYCCMSPPLPTPAPISTQVPAYGSDEIVPCGWQYTDPSETFMMIEGYYSFYPGILDCYVNEERVRPQAGGFYGGWVTDEIVGPIKGAPGSQGW